MPKSTRDLLLRHQDQALNNLDRFIDSMGKLYEYYNPTHPAQALKCVEFSQLAVELKGLVNRFRREMM